jgi:hypothetical protein
VTIVLAVGGCGEKSTAVAVDGNVTYQGKTFDNGSITFYPAAGRPVNTPITADGAYAVELEPGEYVVGVNYSEPLPPGFKEGDPVPPPKFVIPPEYSTRAKSKLSATVAADQSEPIDFKLE